MSRKLSSHRMVTNFLNHGRVITFFQILKISILCSPITNSLFYFPEYLTEDDLEFFTPEDREEEERRVRKSAMQVQQEIHKMLHQEFGSGESLPPEAAKDFILQVTPSYFS